MPVVVRTRPARWGCNLPYAVKKLFELKSPLDMNTPSMPRFAIRATYGLKLVV